MPLHVDYRPMSYEEMIGNKETLESLALCMAREDKPHALLFTGPSGCGKTTLARIVKDQLGCGRMDFYEVDAAKERGIKDMKDLVSRVNLAPMSGKVKFYLLDEVHQITGDAANALLKVLEEPPRHVFFALCTTEPQKLINTIRTRCAEFSVRRLNKFEIIELLTWVMTNETIELWDSIPREIAEACDGCPRQALVLLDQVMELKDEQTAIDLIRSGSVRQAEFGEILRLLRQEKPGWNKWVKIRGVFSKVGDLDPEKARRGVLAYFGVILMNAETEEKTRVCAEIMSHFADPLYDSGIDGLKLALYMTSYI